jgi:hypothetical protein
MQYKGKDEGLLIQDEEGNVYFLRPEILEATKVPEGDTQFVASRSAAGILGRIRVDKPLDALIVKQIPQASTVMCPW